MLKVFSGKESKTPRGSLRRLSVWLPVLITIVVTIKFPNPSTLTWGVEVLMVKLGEAETAKAKATRTMREARRKEKRIVRKAVEAVDERTLNEPGLNIPPVLHQYTDPMGLSVPENSSCGTGCEDILGRFVV
jgi:hypothetical protein